MGRCEWQFHGVSRTENSDGTVTLELTGHRYTTSAERKAGARPVVKAGQPCMTRTVPQKFTEWAPGDIRKLMESPEAGEMATEHCGDPYTVVWQGKGWTVEVSSFYPLWRT